MWRCGWTGGEVEEVIVFAGGEVLPLPVTADPGAHQRDSRFAIGDLIGRIHPIVGVGVIDEVTGVDERLPD